MEHTVKEVENYANTVLNAEQKPSLSDFIENVFVALEQTDTQLQTTWALAKTLYLSNISLMPVKSYVVMHQRARRAESAKFESLPIYNAVCQMKTIYKKGNELTDEQERLFDKYILEGKLNGVTLDANDRSDLQYNLSKLSEEKIIYESKVNVALDQFSHIINEYSSVRSFPSKLLQAMSIDPKNHLNGPWKITLKPYIYNGFMENCPDGLERWNVCQANSRKASRFQTRELDNSIHIERIRDFRKRQANLLGYQNYAQMSMETKMIGSLENAQKFINDLLIYAYPKQEADLKKLTDFAFKNGFGGMALEEHDIPYWKRKYNISVHQFDEYLIQDYFPLTKVLDGMFAITEKLFNIKIVERSDNVTRWHDNVQFYDIFDTSKNGLTTGSGQPIAKFFLDVCPPDGDNTRNNGSMPNGWTVTIRDKCSFNNSTPLLSIIFNFSAPLYGKPCTLSLQEVKILFAKFGYALPDLLSETNYRELAGNRNVEWDAVEVTSNLFTNLLYRTDILKSISEHVATKEPLSDQLIKSIQNERLTMISYHLCNELYISALDLELYSKTDFWLDIVRKLWPQYNTFKLDKRESKLCSMVEIISQNWFGAYFSHLWSQLIAADIYNAFDEASKGKNPNEQLLEVGQRYRQSYLALGGACHQSKVFRDFRGRDPSSQALINQLELKQINKS